MTEIKSHGKHREAAPLENAGCARFLTEEELVALLALRSILRGPTSTQTIVSIGYKTGGPMLAFLTMLVWATPVLLVMTALLFLYAVLKCTDGERVF